MDTIVSLMCLGIPLGIAIATILVLAYGRHILLVPFNAIGRIYMDIVNKK